MARDHVVEREIRALAAAVLAGVVVPREYLAPAELDARAGPVGPGGGGGSLTMVRGARRVERLVVVLHDLRLEPEDQVEAPRTLQTLSGS